MQVLFDHQVFTWQKFGGISRVFYELIKNNDFYTPYVSGRFSENIYSEELRLHKHFPVRTNFKGKAKLIAFLNRIDSLQKLKQANFKIFQPTYYDNYYIGKTGYKKIVVFVHDMTHEKYPELFLKDRTSLIKKKSIMTADKIIVVSENTRKDLFYFYPELTSDKVEVVHLAASLPLRQKICHRKNYILFVGQRVAYKNFEFFFQAVAPLLKKYDLRLICTGNPFSNYEKTIFDNYDLLDRVEQLFVSEDGLSDLYANALLFVFPSLYEGFGMPVLEAFASGCPCVLSNASSLPEIGGDAAIYFDPFSIEDIRMNLEKVILSPVLQSEMVERGYRRLEHFSWQKCVQKVSMIYQKTLNA